MYKKNFWSPNRAKNWKAYSFQARPDVNQLEYRLSTSNHQFLQLFFGTSSRKHQLFYCFQVQVSFLEFAIEVPEGPNRMPLSRQRMSPRFHRSISLSFDVLWISHRPSPYSLQQIVFFLRGFTGICWFSYWWRLSTLSHQQWWHSGWHLGSYRIFERLITFKHLSTNHGKWIRTRPLCSRLS